MKQRVETTDGRYVKIADGEWWDTAGVDIVSDGIVELYMTLHHVGWIVIGVSPTIH